jgi:hypothetical protein
MNPPQHRHPLSLKKSSMPHSDASFPAQLKFELRIMVIRMVLTGHTELLRGLGNISLSRTDREQAIMQGFPEAAS